MNTCKLSSVIFTLVSLWILRGYNFTSINGMNHRLKSVILNKFGKGESFIQELKTSYTEAVGHMKLLYT